MTAEAPVEANEQLLQAVEIVRNWIDRWAPSVGQAIALTALNRIKTYLAQPEADDAPVGPILTLAEMREILKMPDQPEAAELCGAYSVNLGGPEPEQGWMCPDCGDVTDTMECPKGRSNAAPVAAQLKAYEPFVTSSPDHNIAQEADSFALICLRWAECTGGHLTVEYMHTLLSILCFCDVAPKDADQAVHDSKPAVAAQPDALVEELEAEMRTFSRPGGIHTAISDGLLKRIIAALRGRQQ